MQSATCGRRSGGGARLGAPPSWRGAYGITGNLRALQRLQYEATRAWRKWLSRRSQRARGNWVRMHALLGRYPLPPPRIARPYTPRAANP